MIKRIKRELARLRLRLIKWLVGNTSIMFNTRIYGNWTKIKVSSTTKHRTLVSGIAFDNTMDRGGTGPDDAVGTIARAMELASPDGEGKNIYVCPSSGEVIFADCDRAK